MLFFCTKSEEARCPKSKRNFVGYDKDNPSYLVCYPETKHVKRARCVKFIDNFQIEQSQIGLKTPFPDGKPNETVAERHEISKIPSIAEEKQGTKPLVDITTDTEQVHA